LRLNFGNGNGETKDLEGEMGRGSGGVVGKGNLENMGEGLHLHF